MRILVLGRSGQLAQCLAQAATGSDIVLACVGRPETDLGNRAALDAAIATHHPDVVVNAAAYTAVDKAESEREAAYAVNATGAGQAAAASASAGIPVIHVSTDYVFDGGKAAPYVESDATGPVSVYGASKLEGERRVATANPRHIIVRTAWVVSPFGANFVKTMLRLAAERDELRVVADQIGSPTNAVDLAGALLAIARQVKDAPAADARWGIYHATNSGTATWADLAEATLAASARHGGRVVPVRRITTADYPTPARRPANSRLDGAKLARTFGITLPPWQDAVTRCVEALYSSAR